MISKNPLIQKFLSLHLPKEDCALFGSAIMHFHGLKELGHDIDIIARDKAWIKACSLSKPKIPFSKKGLVVMPFGNEIEIFNDWAPGEWNINELIDTAVDFGDLKVVDFEYVIKWKKLMGREKDFEHIKIIENYLRNKH